MNFAEVKIRIDKVINSCVNQKQLFNAEVYCMRLIDKNFPHNESIIDNLKRHQSWEFYLLIYDLKRRSLKGGIWK